MALLNENRNRIPLTAGTPGTGAAAGIRGQMRMTETEGDANLYVCTHNGPAYPVASVTIGSVIYSALENSTAGNSITVEYADGGAGTGIVISVTGTDILATVDAAATTDAQIAYAINTDDDAKALVDATDGDATITGVQVPTNLAGGGAAVTAVAADIVIAAATDGITYTAKVVDAAEADGNLISVAHVDPSALNAVLSVVVTGTAIVVNLATDGAGAITTDVDAIEAAILASPAAAALVTAVQIGTGTELAIDVAATFLAGGVTGTAVWTTVAL